MRIWPFSRLSDAADRRRQIAEEAEDRRRRAEEARVVATHTYTTNVVKDDGTKTGISYRHVVSFTMDGNGRRSSSIESSSQAYAESHGGIVESRAYWRTHGKLPDGCWRVDGRTRGKLIAIDGGKGAA